jgi:hypothetical protein
MNLCKLLALSFTIMILILISNQCSKKEKKEGLTNIFQDNPALECDDDPEWTLGDGITCKDIGTRASCYSFDLRQRDGWESCRKSCGNCSYTKVTQVPMDVLPGFSGDPIEDFGIVLSMDKSRKFVAQGPDTIKLPTDELDDMSEDIDNMNDRVDSLENVFAIVTKGTKKCDYTKKCSGKYYNNCDKECIDCPSQSVSDTNKKHAYVEVTCLKDDKYCSPKLPIKHVSCKDAAEKKKKSKPKFDCQKHILMKNISSLNKDKKDKKDKKLPKTLYDMCPEQCGNTNCN